MNPPSDPQETLQAILDAMGNRILELRIKKGYTSHADFANDHRLPPIQYWRMEKGKANMTLKSLHKILSIHGIQLKDFFSTMKERNR